MEIVKKHLITIFCAISVVLLLLPLVTVVSKVESMIGSQVTKASVSGMKALDIGFYAYFMVLCPVILAASNYVKQLDKYKAILAVAAPVISLICLLIVILQAKNFVSVTSAGTLGKAKISTQLSIGAILLIITHIATAAAGIFTYHKESLQGVGLEKIKQNASDMFSSVQNKMSGLSFGGESGTAAAVHTDSKTSADGVTEAAPKAAPKKAINLGRTEEILALIERLSKMKEAGVLTEAEFSEKKAQLLEEIK